MSLESLHSSFQSDGLEAITEKQLETSLDWFYVALLAFASDDMAKAHFHAAEAETRDPDNLVFREAKAYLGRVVENGKQSVYVSGEAFADFIRGGGNIGLYEATSQALRTVYQEHQSSRVLDIGVGDGLALIPAITDTISRLDLVEPSGAMLSRTTAALAKTGITIKAFEGSVQAYIAANPAPEVWDVAQATFSFQSVPPAERSSVLQWLRAHSKRLLIVEFDVPTFCEVSLSPECVRHVLARYQQGLAEYKDDGGKVAQGFLMPVMFGYFDPTQARTNYEQPIQLWMDKLLANGFTTVKGTRLFPYWWADAYIIDAR